VTQRVDSYRGLKAYEEERMNFIVLLDVDDSI
jgi:hypothetical protein